MMSDSSAIMSGSSKGNRFSAICVATHFPSKCIHECGSTLATLPQLLKNLPNLPACQPVFPSIRYVNPYICLMIISWWMPTLQRFRPVLGNLLRFPLPLLWRDSHALGSTTTGTVRASARPWRSLVLMAIRGGLNLGTEFRRVLGIVLGGRSPGCYRGFEFGVSTGRVF